MLSVVTPLGPEQRYQVPKGHLKYGPKFQSGEFSIFVCLFICHFQQAPTRRMGFLGGVQSGYCNQKCRHTMNNKDQLAQLINNR
jgi:hypothetical protein